MAEAQMDSSYSLATEFHMRGGRGVQYKYRKHKGSTQLEALPKSRKQTATNFDGPI